MNVEKIKIDKATLEAIEKTLSKGDRVELIPVKDGVKAVEVKRKEIKQTKNIMNDMNNSTANFIPCQVQILSNDPIIEINGTINKKDIVC